MEIVELNRENASLYREIIDPDVWESIGRRFYRGIVVIEEDRGPSGAMVWEYRNMEEPQPTDAKICFIRAENRYTADRLLEEYEHRLLSQNIGKSFFELENLPRMTRDALECAGFDTVEGEGQDLVITTGDLTPLLSDRKKTSPHIIPLSEVSETRFMQGISTCLFMGEKGILEDLAYIKRDWFDPASSVCIITGEMVSGMFLLHRFPSGTLMPVLFYAVGSAHQHDLLNMIRVSAGLIYDTYPTATPIVLRRNKPYITTFTRRAFGDRPGKQVLKGTR